MYLNISSNKSSAKRVKNNSAQQRLNTCWLYLSSILQFVWKFLFQYIFLSLPPSGADVLYPCSDVCDTSVPNQPPCSYSIQVDCLTVSLHSPNGRQFCLPAVMGLCCRIWSWSPMSYEKHGPLASVTTKTSAEFLLLLRPEGHVFHTTWETMIKSYYSTLPDWFFSKFYSHKYEFFVL